MSEHTAYPLSWPAGWPKTDASRRETARFNTTLPAALANLQKQIKLMGGKNLILSSNYTLGSANPKEPGVVAYFDWCAEPHKYPQQFLSMAIPCDRWLRIEHNVQAIALTVEAMRGMERWGAKHMIKAMFTGFKALPAAKSSDWWVVLDVDRNAQVDHIKERYRSLVKQFHPDNGGSTDDFRRVQTAYEQFEREAGAART